MKNVHLYYSKDISTKYFEKGIAIIVMDRVVMYYKVPEASNVDGFLYGEIHADYLHDLEDSQHEGFSDTEPWLKTEKLIRKWGREIISKVRDFDDIKIEVGSIDTEFIDEVNDFLKKYLPPDEELYGKSSYGKEESPEDISDLVKYIVSLNTFLDGTTQNISKYKRGQKLNVKITIKNPIEKTLKAKLKFYTKPDMGYDSDWDDISLPKNKIQVLTYEMDIPTTTPRGNISFIAELYKKKVKNNKLDEFSAGYEKDKTESKNIQEDLEDIREKVREDLQSDKILDTKIKTGPLEKLITNIAFSKKNYALNDKIELKAEFDINELKHLSLSNTNARMILYNENNQLSQNLIALKGSTKDIEMNYQLDPFDDQRGGYKGYVEIFDITTNRIIDKASTFCNVEKFLVDLSVPKKVLKYDEEFDIKMKLDNPTLNTIKGNLSLELEGSFKDTPLFLKEFEIEGQGSPNIPLIVPYTYSFKKKDNWAIGGVQIKAKFVLESDPNYENVIIRKVYLAKQKVGLLSDITFNKNLDMIEPVEKDIDGTIKVNVLHYLFKRLDDKSGLNTQLFHQTIANLLYEVLKDELTEDITWYEFEEDFMNVIGKRYGGN